MAAEPVSEVATPSSLVELLQTLSVDMGLAVPDEEIHAAAAAVDAATPWTSQLEEAGAGVGLAMRWLVAPVDDAMVLARPDLPVVGRSEAGVFWVLDGRGPGLVHGVPVDDPRGGQWMTAASLRRRVGSEAQTWALVEPILPAAPLASPEKPRSPWRRLQALLSLEGRDVVVVMLYGAVAGLLALATPLAIQVLINWLAFGALLQPILVVGSALFVCLALAAGLQLLQRLGVETIERRIFVRTVGDLAARLSRVRVAALDGASGPELANRFFDVLTLQKAASTLLLDGFTAVLQVAVAVTVLGLYHPWLLLFDVLLLAGMALVLFPLGRGAQRTAILESKAKYRVAAWIEEVARHPMMLRQDGSRLAERRAETLAREWLDTRRDHFAVFIRQYFGVQALQVLMSATLLVTSGILVLEGQLTIGQLVAAEFIVTTALLGFAKFADKLDTVYDLLAGVDKLGNLLDLPPERLSGLPGRANGPSDLELLGVAHSGSAGELGPLDLQVAPGERVLIAGPPGAGKSTLASIATGIRTPQHGVVRRQGIDLRELRPDARYRGVIKVCESDLLGGTVRDNVSLGRDGVTDPAIWAALDEVGLRRTVELLPQGLETMMTSGGHPLSLPDQRRLLIARAIVSEPRLVIVDGVLDGLPGDLRRRLQRVVSRLGVPWTLLLLTSEPDGLEPLDRHLTLGAGGLS